MNDGSNHNRIGGRDFFFYVLIALIIFAVLSIMGRIDRSSAYSYAEVRRYFVQEKVETFRVSGNTLTLHLKEALPNGGDTVTYKLASAEQFQNDLGPLIAQQLDRGILLDCDYAAAFQPPWWLSYVILIAVAVFLFGGIRLGGARQGGGPGEQAGRFGKARVRSLTDKDKKVTFNDVAGADEEKEELREVVEFLKDPQRYIRLGARIPKGILLVGPPGTGKTLLARAVAGEAGVNFLSISGSDFVELYVGIGASRVRDLFNQAKEDSPAIVFIDEIDAVGRQRGAGLGGGHDEREQTLNQLLVEMDGFSANEGVIVMAATNRRDILDPALLRPGRFDRQVYVGYPDIRGREEILKIHARNKPLGDDVSLKDVARATAGFTGADLENLMNEGALLAARSGRPYINKEDLHEAMLKVIAGPEKKSRVVTESARRLTAYHEAGHAVVEHELETADPVHQITIVPRGGAGGMTISLPTEDKSFLSKRELSERIAGLLGGRVAEALVLGDVSTGASNDLERATALARDMVTRYGMSEELGPVTFDTGHNVVFIGRDMAQAKPYSEEVAGQIDRAVRTIIEAGYRRCEEILSRRRDILEQVASYLLEHETMDGETFETCFHPGEAPKGETETPPTEE